LQLRLEDFRSSGARLAAISVDPVARNLELASQHGIDFPLLSDPDAEAIRAFGVFHPGAGPGGSDLARPATFIFTGGVLRWRNLTDNYRIRPRPELLLQALGRP
jgi:peroxiredoxin